MPDTYASQDDQDRDHALLETALKALGISPSRLRLDECRLWTIQGRAPSYISTWGDGESFLLFVEMHSIKAMTFAKKKLDRFIELTQDGEETAVFRFRLPLKAGVAEAIREVGGFRKEVEYTAEERERRVAAIAEARARRKLS